MNKKLFVTTIPNFSETGINSFCWFLESGLSQELRKYASLLDLINNSSRKIRAYSDEFVLRRPKCSPVECKRYDLTYSIKIYVPIELITDNLVREALVLWAEVPLMTNGGTFVINGCERVIINQIIRNPGVYYKRQKNIKKLEYSAILISKRGSWIKFEYDVKTKDVFIRLNKLNIIKVSDLLKLCNIKYTSAEAQFILKQISDPVKNYIDDYTENLESFKFNFLSPNKQNPSNDITDISGNIFLRIFNSKFYDLGKTGRKKLNDKFCLSVPEHVSDITIDDIIAITNYLIKLHSGLGNIDDIDDLKNRRIRSVGELLQLQVNVGLARLRRSISEKLTDSEFPAGEISPFLNSKPLIATINEFFGSSQLSQFMDQTNPIASLTHKRRITSLGPGGLNRERLSLAVRDIHPSYYGRICPIDTPEGQNVGLLMSLASYTRVNELGSLETPFFKVSKGEILDTEVPIYLTAEEEEKIPTTLADSIINSNKIISDEFAIPIRHQNEFNMASSNHVDLISVSPIQSISLATSLIPFLEHNDANRALMGSNMQRQAEPLLYPSKPIVGTGLEHQIATDSGSVLVSKFGGVVKYVSSQLIAIETLENEIVIYKLQKFVRSNQETCINQRPIVWPNEHVSSGQIIADGPATSGGELALGQNLLVAYMPWEGYNYEDAILINERLIEEDLFTSIHIEKFDLEVNVTDFGAERVTRDVPYVKGEYLTDLDSHGIIYKGTFVTSGDILVGKSTPMSETGHLPEGLLLKAIFGEKHRNVYDSSLRVPKGSLGRVIKISMLRNPKNYLLEDGGLCLVRIFIANRRKIKVGDKIAGRHGNKGIISRILPKQDMPFLPNGISVDILLNPLGVPSRMNVGQIFECLLGLAGSKLKKRFKVRPFDEMYGIEASRNLVNWYLSKAANELNEPWLFNNSSPGRVTLRDGRTGLLFDNPVLIGQAYMLKLIHQIDDKMHARSTGPYALISQQPLGGKSRLGGQRFGEMEVWALQAFGCAYTLRELLTTKSDDIDGRNKILRTIISGEDIAKPDIPEAFKALMSELHSLGLDISLYKLRKEVPEYSSEAEIDLVYEYEKKLTLLSSKTKTNYNKK